MNIIDRIQVTNEYDVTFNVTLEPSEEPKRPLIKFYDAEKYHQDFYSNNENYGYCRVIINPKLAKFRKRFEPYLKTSN